MRAAPSGLRVAFSTRDDYLSAMAASGMTLPGAAALAAVRRTFARARSAGATIAQLISALDDRDVRGALELLDPPATRGDSPVRRIKCAGGCKE
jgi:hypothetical protein